MVQPYIMAIGHARCIGKKFLVVGDSKIVELNRNAAPANAIDVLFKSFFAFRAHFPLGWKNVLRFLQVHVYDIPLENPRKSKFKEVLIRIKNC
jgi:hypothetical protein